MALLHDIVSEKILPVCFFKKTDGQDFTIVEDDTAADDNIKVEKRRVFICGYCSHIITTPEDVTEINGRHMHVFKNPAGFVYEIGCFRYAEGCVNMGDPTEEYTWFPGFAWTYSICRSCYNHMGWYFGVNGSGFYGLVLDYLTENI